MNLAAAACAVLVLSSAALPARAADGIADAVADARPIGAEVLVVDHGRVLYEHGFGVRDAATRAPVDAETHFEIGSVTKQFTAAAIMQLVEQGKVALRDPLGRYVPQYRPGSHVTVEELLWQTSGIPEFTSTPAFEDHLTLRDGRLQFVKPIVFSDVLAMLGDRPLDFTPGTRWEYSNTNYAVLAAIVAAASGMTWERYVRDHLFRPAGMRNSGFVNEEQQLPDMATGYGSVPGKAGAIPTGAQLNAGGPGGIVTTARDLARWNDALFGGKIVSHRSLALMTTPSAASRRAHHDYGFALQLQRFDGVLRVFHTGGTLGFSAIDEVYPALGQQVIVLANASFASTPTIADAAFEAHNPRLAAGAHVEDPAVTALVRRLWSGMASGHVDQTLLSPQMGRFIAAPGAHVSQFAGYGPLSTLTFRGRRELPAGLAYRYRLGFADGRWIVLTVGVTPQRKVAFLGFSKG